MKLGLPKFFNKRKERLSEDDQETIIEAAVLVGIGFPCIALVTLGSIAVFVGGVMVIVPGPHQPLALPLLLAGLPAAAAGATGGSAVGAYVVGSNYSYLAPSDSANDDTAAENVNNDGTPVLAA